MCMVCSCVNVHSYVSVIYVCLITCVHIYMYENGVTLCGVCTCMQVYLCTYDMCVVSAHVCRYTYVFGGAVSIHVCRYAYV